MDQAALQKKLFAAARAEAPSGRVPYGFEKRVLAHVASRSPLDELGELVRAFWRGAFACLGVMTLLCAWSFFSSSSLAADDDLSADLEHTVLVAAEQYDPAQPGL